MADNQTAEMPIMTDNAADLFQYIERHGEFSAADRESRIWDRCTPAGRPEEGTINRGRGFEYILSVPTESGGFMLYFGPFEIESVPTEETKLTFTCSEYIFIHPTKSLI